MGDDYDAYDYSGPPENAAAVGIPATFAQNLPGDFADAQTMGPFTPPAAAATGAPWWAGMVGYGIVKAIDNQFPGQPTGVYGNVYPGSGAGYGGGTYTQRPVGVGGGVSTNKNGSQFNLQFDPMLLLLLAGAFVLLKR